MKAQQVSEAMKRALADDQIAGTISGILGGTVGKRDQGNSQMKGPGGAQKPRVDVVGKGTGKEKSVSYSATQLGLDAALCLLEPQSTVFLAESIPNAARSHR